MKNKGTNAFTRPLATRAPPHEAPTVSGLIGESSAVPARRC